MTTFFNTFQAILNIQTETKLST